MDKRTETQISADQERRLAELQLGALIDAADASGLSDRTASEIWEEAISDIAGPDR